MFRSGFGLRKAFRLPTGRAAAQLSQRRWRACATVKFRRFEKLPLRLRASAADSAVADLDAVQGRSDPVKEAAAIPAGAAARPWLVTIDSWRSVSEIMGILAWDRRHCLAKPSRR